MSKYAPLERYLNQASITLSYNEIEQILGFKLPESAYNREQWWSGQTTEHTQAKSWLNAGWKVHNIELSKSVTFIRDGL
ncbi:hypothetical protein NST28_22550 [Paenibacillus sp. FSL R10-2791]|uniref:DUF7662 domain-containing protein n=1 Tax=Paenibacillus sp. FSL R10-2791 TaxID=2954695 RepID=UPI0030F806A0